MPREDIESTAQDGAKKDEEVKDLSAFFVSASDYDKNKAQNLLKAAQENNASLENGEKSEGLFKSTNNAYLDEKLRNNTLTIRDMYLAKKFLNMDLENYGKAAEYNVNMNLKSKNLGLTGLNQNLLDSANNADLLDRAIVGSEGNLGFWAWAERALNKATGGFKELSKGEDEWLQSHNEAANALARARNSGRLTNQMLEQAKEDLALGVRKEVPMMEKYLAAKKTNLARWSREIENAITHNLAVNPEILARYDNEIQSVNYLDEQMKKGKWNSSNYKFYAQNFAKRYSQDKNQNTQKANEQNLRALEKKKKSE